ncbi:DUF6491 family protein [Pseudoxanthomonas sp. 10H]|uniref:DUF6491 family protein n=1 Tax=Pseudoxanthomonas sp. 10H TaxID=3242729 RepID=UPI0035587334
MNRIWNALALALLLTGCAHSGPALSPAERLELYRTHAGAPVASFNIDRVAGVNRWTPLGDQALAIWNTPNRGYLLEFRSRCAGLSLGSSITISNSLGMVNPRLDSVQPRAANGSAISQPCRISSARPLDGRAISDAKRELREASVVDRPEGVAPEEE